MPKGVLIQNNLISHLEATRKGRVCKGTPDTFSLDQNVIMSLLYGLQDLLRKVGINSQSEVRKSWKVEAAIVHCCELC